MKKLLKLCLLSMTIFLLTCVNNDTIVRSQANTFDSKINNSILIIYKIHSMCKTSILENIDGRIDTIAKDISYLCIPVSINQPEVFGDTTLITMFFKPENGYEIEDPQCEFAYSVGFIGPDDIFDFVEFGDNYYSLNSEEIKKKWPQIDIDFNNKVRNTKCLSSQLSHLIDFRE